MERHPRLLTDTHTHTHTHYIHNDADSITSKHLNSFSRVLSVFSLCKSIFSLYIFLIDRMEKSKLLVIFFNRHCRSFFIFDYRTIVNENNLESQLRKRRIIRSFSSSMLIHVCRRMQRTRRRRRRRQFTTRINRGEKRLNK